MEVDDAEATTTAYCPPYNGPSYSDLPMEIIIQIIGYLHPSDIIYISLTCRRLFEAAQHLHFRQNVQLHFSKIHLDDSDAPLTYFQNSSRNYPKIVLNQIDFGSKCATAFWDRMGETLVSLAIQNCDVREKSLNEILKRISQLRSLEIDNCRELFMSGRLFENEKDKQAICYACKDVESLTLTNNRYLSDALFNRFVAIMPKLRSLNLSGCHISFHKGLYRKFYPQNQKDASESVLTFHYISQFIECEAHMIKELNFGTTLIDGTALEVLSKLPNLKLEKLLLQSCDQLTNTGIISLIQMQPNLQELNLSNSVRLTDAGLLEICYSLPALKVLRIRKCRAITDMGVKELINLRQLRVLDISECEPITSRGIVDGIAKARHLQLHELYVSALNICEMAIIQLAENLPSLRVLDLSFCKNGVTNLALQIVFKHLRMLRVLNLEYCDKISDAGLTGMEMDEQVRNYELSKLHIMEKVSSKDHAQQNNADPHPMEVLREAMINVEPGRNNMADLGGGNRSFKISLRSKAEEDIVNDAKRKKMMLSLYEQSRISQTGYSGYSINCLRGLRRLNLASCNKVSDVSLRFSFVLFELNDVNFAKCQQISTIGIAHLIANCPSLERMNLSECHNISDKTIEMITIRLKRLTHLYLERCTQLSDHSLDYMTVNCQVLRYLDVRGCRNMCAEPNLRLANLTSLRHVAKSNPGPYLIDVDTITMKRPRPPPMPMAF